MIALDEDALICDMAETYHIYNMEQLPVEYVATLAIGLRDDSRIKLRAAGLKVDIKTMLLAHVADNTAINFYMKTKDAQHGRNKPKSMVQAFQIEDDTQDHAKQFDSGEAFLEEWRRLNGN